MQRRLRRPAALTAIANHCECREFLKVEERLEELVKPESFVMGNLEWSAKVVTGISGGQSVMALWRGPVGDQQRKELLVTTEAAPALQKGKRENRQTIMSRDLEMDQMLLLLFLTSLPPRSSGRHCRRGRMMKSGSDE